MLQKQGSNALRTQILPASVYDSATACPCHLQFIDDSCGSHGLGVGLCLPACPMSAYMEAGYPLTCMLSPSMSVSVFARLYVDIFRSHWRRNRLKTKH